MIRSGRSTSVKNTLISCKPTFANTSEATKFACNFTPKFVSYVPGAAIRLAEVIAQIRRSLPAALSYFLPFGL